MNYDYWMLPGLSPDLELEVVDGKIGQFYKLIIVLNLIPKFMQMMVVGISQGYNCYFIVVAQNILLLKLMSLAKLIIVHNFRFIRIKFAQS